jgi:hypothetical protein
MEGTWSPAVPMTWEWWESTLNYLKMHMETFRGPKHTRRNCRLGTGNQQWASLLLNTNNLRTPLEYIV